MVQKLRRPSGGVPGVVAHRSGRDLVAVQKAPRQSSVLGRDQRHPPQHIDGAVCDVPEISNGSRDDE